MTRKYRRPLVALLLALAVVATATLGSAATLTVNAASISTFSVTNPCDGTAEATPSDPVGNSGKYLDVQVSLPDGCSGRLQIAVLDDGSLLTTATVPAASGTFTIDVGQQYYPDDITAVGTLDGWHLPISWSFDSTVDPPVDPPPATGPVTPGTEDTDIKSLTWPTLAGGNQACFAVTVSTTNPNGNRDWALRLDTDQRPFNGATTGYQIGGSDASRVRFESATPDGNGVLTIVGIPPNDKLRSSQALEFTVCNYSTPAPAYDPTLSYSMTTSAPSAEWNPCLTVTVGVVGTPLFYAGWRADVDMTPAIDAITAAGGTFAGTVETRTGDIQIQQLSPTVWRATPTGWNTVGIRDGEVQVVTMCAVRQ